MAVAPLRAQGSGHLAASADGRRLRGARHGSLHDLRRGTVTALENIDLTIPRGSFLTLLGPLGLREVEPLLRVMGRS